MDTSYVTLKYFSVIADRVTATIVWAGKFSVTITIRFASDVISTKEFRNYQSMLIYIFFVEIEFILFLENCIVKCIKNN